jgi:hypothetical protein
VGLRMIIKDVELFSRDNIALLPTKFEVLSVFPSFANGTILTVLVNEQQKCQRVQFSIFETGDSIPNNMKHCGTYNLEGMQIHVFYKKIGPLSNL